MGPGKVSGVVWWIVSGVLLLAVVVLGITLAALGGRMRPLRRELGRLQTRAEQAQKLQTRALEVQERAIDLAGRVEEVSASAEHLRDRRPSALAGGDGRPLGGFDGRARSTGHR
jgi:hypothetical protein